MAINPAISIDYTQWPRIVNVAAPVTEVNCQDIHDTLSLLQSNVGAIDERGIINSSGLEELGGGVQVGLTVTLLDALLRFEARTEQTICKVTGGNLVSYNSDAGEFREVPLAYSEFVMATYTSSSSATQSNLDALNYSSYQNAVWLDLNSSSSGTEFPSGTRETPVNNLYDAREIAVDKGFDTINFLTPATLPADINLDDFSLVGRSPTQTFVFIPPTTSTQRTRFTNMYVAGTLNFDAFIDLCVTGDLDYINGIIRKTSISGDVHVRGGASVILIDCGSADLVAPPTFDMGGTGQYMVARNYQGDMRLTNFNDPVLECSIFFHNGMLEIDPTVSDGTVEVRGHVELVDNSTGNAAIKSDYIMNPYNVADKTWEYTRA